jgi:hypothetical protein
MNLSPGIAPLHGCPSELGFINDHKRVIGTNPTGELITCGLPTREPNQTSTNIEETSDLIQKFSRLTVTAVLFAKRIDQ